VSCARQHYAGRRVAECATVRQNNQLRKTTAYYEAANESYADAFRRALLQDTEPQ